MNYLCWLVWLLWQLLYRVKTPGLNPMVVARRIWLRFRRPLRHFEGGIGFGSFHNPNRFSLAWASSSSSSKRHVRYINRKVILAFESTNCRHEFDTLYAVAV